MKHVIKRIDELVAQTDQDKAMWHVLMCVRLAAVDDWNIQQEIVDEVKAKMDGTSDLVYDRYEEGTSMRWTSYLVRSKRKQALHQ